MRDKTADPQFLLQEKIELKFSKISRKMAPALLYGKF